MQSPVRRLIIAAGIAACVAAASVAAVLALGGDGGTDVDGEFVLDQPGIYSEPVATAVVEGRPLPEITLVDAAGAPVALTSFAGTPLVINVWYSTCAPCARELRDFAEVSAEHAGHVQFVGIDPIDDVATMTAFATARGVDYPLLLDTDQRFVTELPVTSFPTTLFVSAEGRIVHQTSVISAADLRATIDEVF